MVWIKAFLCASTLAVAIPQIYGLQDATQTTASPLQIVSLLQARQADTSAIPSDCQGKCAPLVTQANSCAKDGQLENIDPKCLCTPSLAGNVNDCSSCIVDLTKDPNDADQAKQVQPAIDQFCSGTSSDDGDDNGVSTLSVQTTVFAVVAIAQLGLLV